MHYEGNVIRPPSEADSIILQVTVGCSHNRCTFCGAYKDVRFRIKERKVIDADIDFAATYCRRQNKVFLADGDVLILPQKRLVPLLEKIRLRLPWVNRISLYANARSIMAKSPAELAELKQLGLDRVYMGVESGSDTVLAAIRKGTDSAGMIRAGCRVRDAGLFLSVTVLLGIGGEAGSMEHAIATGRVVSDSGANQIAALTIILLPNTPLYLAEKAKLFKIPDRNGLLRELRTMITHISAPRVQFQANHASNYLPISCRLSRDKEKILTMIDAALVDGTALRPEHLRAL